MANLEIKDSTLARNALLNFLGQGTLVLIGVVTIPFIIRGLCRPLWPFVVRLGSFRVLYCFLLGDGAGDDKVYRRGSWERP